MFVNIKPFINLSTAEDIKKYIGVIINKDEEIILSDPVRNLKSDEVYIPVKYYNFCITAAYITKRVKVIEQGGIKRVLPVFGREEFERTLQKVKSLFDGGKPRYIVNGVNAVSYNQLVKEAKAKWDRNGIILIYE